MATNNAINTSLDDQTGSGKFVGDTNPVFPSNVDVGANIRHDGDTTNYIAFGTQAQEYFTNGTSRMDINNSGIRLSATGARVNLISDDTTMAADSSTTLVTQHAAKTYTDTVIGSGAGGTNGQLQYNNSGAFGGDNITTDGFGNWTGDIALSGSLAVDILSLNGSTITTPVVNGNVSVNGNGTGYLSTTNLQVDNINVNGNSITSTSSFISITPANSQSLSLNATGGGSINNTVATTGNYNINLGTGKWILNSTTGISSVLDEDNMASNSNTALATQQSIKAYVDSEIASAAGGSNTQIQYNSSGALGGDSGFTTNGSGSVNIVGDLDVDNININGNSITSTNTNGDINLSPNGTGTVVINTDLDIDNINANGNTISTTNTNGDLLLSPNGTGALNIQTDTIYIGDTIRHTGNVANYISFTSNTQTYYTNGVSRLDITNSGVRMGAANARVTTILDEDTMSSNSATALATQQSIKAYVDTSSKVVQVVTATSSTNDATTSLSLVNSSLSATITPTSASNKLIITVAGYGRVGRTSATPSNRFAEYDVYNSTTAASLGSYFCGRGLVAASTATAYSGYNLAATYAITSPGTSAYTFVLRYAALETGTTAEVRGGSVPATMVIMEVLP